MKMSNETLYQRLIEPVEPRMLNIIGHIVQVPEDCADVMQEVLSIVWCKLSLIERADNPQAYILRICVTQSYEYLRKRYAQYEHEKRLARDRSKPPVNSVNDSESAETRQVILSAIGRLPKKQAKALLLRTTENMGYEDMAPVLGCSVATARSHVHKARVRLRTALTQIGILVDSGGEA